MYTVTFYSKYDIKQSIKLSNVSEEDCKVIQKAFTNKNIDNHAILNNKLEIESDFKSQIDLNEIVCIEYFKQKNPVT